MATGFSACTAGHMGARATWERRRGGACAPYGPALGTALQAGSPVSGRAWTTARGCMDATRGAMQPETRWGTLPRARGPATPVGHQRGCQCRHAVVLLRRTPPIAGRLCPGTCNSGASISLEGSLWRSSSITGWARACATCLNPDIQRPAASKQQPTSGSRLQQRQHAPAAASRRRAIASSSRQQAPTAPGVHFMRLSAQECGLVAGKSSGAP